MAAIVASYGVRSKQARETVAFFRTCRYGPAEPEALDFFPASPARSGRGSPALVYVHGGYWQELSKDEHSFPALALTRRGIAYIAVNYGLAPGATLDVMVERCRRALAWIVANAQSLGVDPEALCVAGSSAGAHLAAMMALTDWSRYGLRTSPIRSLCLLSGVFDLRPLVLTYVND